MQIIKKINGIKLLRLTLLAGFIFLFIAAAVLTVFSIIRRDSTVSTRQQDNFYRIMREYDIAASAFFGTEREYDHLNNELDRLEKNAISVESWLSILKRRRALSLNHSQSLVNYRRSINNALAIYPVSQPIAAIAAAAIVKDSALNRETEEQLRLILPLLTETSFNTLSLCLHVLLGDFSTPQRASLIVSDITSDGTEAITVNLAILKTQRGDYRGATADIQGMLGTTSYELLSENDTQTAGNWQIEPNILVSAETLRFAGEFHYDFGELIRSAEIFSYINDNEANVRQADALYLAGYKDSAMSIWNILADTNNETTLYNLAVLSQEKNELFRAADYFEQLINIETVTNIDSRQFALIHYSRLFDLPRALTILQNTASFSPLAFPYIDLEICKRHAHSWGLNRQIAETWLLLDRHYQNEEMYKWAAWHFFFQRRFDEIPVLIDRLNHLSFSSSWVDLYKALYLMNDGNLQEAETILLSIPIQDANWQLYANLGRVYDEMRSTSRALVQYETAASILQSAILDEQATASNEQIRKTAARLQQRIARCFISLGRQSDALRVLLYAQNLDPDNLGVRLDLERLMF